MLMQRVKTAGYVDDYSGVRIASSGRRFTIAGATVWNVADHRGAPLGQAASFGTWHDA